VQFLLPVIISLLGGVAIGLQNPLASLMGQRIGILQGAFIIHLGGTIVAVEATSPPGAASPGTLWLPEHLG